MLVEKEGEGVSSGARPARFGTDEQFRYNSATGARSMNLVIAGRRQPQAPVLPYLTWSMKGMGRLRLHCAPARQAARRRRQLRRIQITRKHRGLELSSLCIWPWALYRFIFPPPFFTVHMAMACV